MRNMQDSGLNPFPSLRLAEIDCKLMHHNYDKYMKENKE